MGVKISPELRQQVLVPQRVSVATNVTHGDAFKVWTQTTGGSLTFTLPQARAGDGPFYFNVASVASVIVVAPQSADSIGGNAAGASVTLPAVIGWFIGFYCNTAGNWSPIGAGAGAVGPAAINGALTINGQFGTTTSLTINSPSTVGSSFGLTVNGGTNLNDWSAIFRNAAGANIFQVRGDRTLWGWGTDAGALVDMTPDSGTYTGTLTGVTTTVTGTVVFGRMGPIGIINLPGGLTGTSNTTACTITGALPANMQGVRTQIIAIPSGAFEDNTTGISTAQILIGGSSTITFRNNGNAGGFTAAGTKGVLSSFTFCYLLI